VSVRVTTALAALLTSGLVLLACDDGGGSDIESACDLLTTAEVEQVMGTDMYGGSQDTDRTIPGTFCEWTSTDYVGEEQENPEYALFIDEGSTDERRESFENREDAKQPETVDGLGDGAYF
jgi:hypothetical protein